MKSVKKKVVIAEPKPYFEEPEITPENTVIVIGCSTFINEVHQNINPLLKKFSGIACNCAAFYFEGFEYIATNDFYPESNFKKIINWDKCKEQIVKKANCHYIFKPEIEEPVLEETTEYCNEFEIHQLYGRHTIALPAINFALLKGYKNAVCIGVDLSPAWNYFYEVPKKVNIRQATCARLRRNRMQIGFKKLNEHINIFNVNPLSLTNSRLIRIERLL